MSLTRLDNLITSKTGKILYVSPDDFNASDAIDNRGNSPTRPFLTIQRAFLEVARYSFVYTSVPNENVNNRFDQFTIQLAPGNHYIDNRPGDATSSTINPFNYINGSWNDSSVFDLGNSNNVLRQFNSIEGGVIIPRGTSLVGTDLRRTKIKPLYVPDPINPSINRTSIFQVTGGCYFWQFTISDGDDSSDSPLYNSGASIGQVYNNPNNTSKVTPYYSHHKITNFVFARQEDLGLLYQKVAAAFSKYESQITNGEFFPRIEENRITGPLLPANRIESITVNDISFNNSPYIKVTIVTKVPHTFHIGQNVAITNVNINENFNGAFSVQGISITDNKQFYYYIKGSVGALGLIDGSITTDQSVINVPGTFAVVQAEMDTVESASPYIFNISIRSTWGICGIWADGSRANGFKSMVVAQYTGISLQKDDRAFIKYDAISNTWNQASLTSAFSTTPYHIDGSAYWKDDWRTFHVKASEDSFIQCVSIFAVGFADHFLLESGGDMSISNSNSNFGNTSLHSKGFKGYAFNQDKGGYISDIIPPEQIDVSNPQSETFYQLNIQLTKQIQNKNRLYLYPVSADNVSYYSPDNRPSTTINGYKIGAKSGETINVFLDAISGESGQQLKSAIISPSGIQKWTASLSTLVPPIGGTYSVGVTSGGSNYNIGDQIKIYGISLGGISPDNDLIVTVSSVNNGAIVNVSVYGNSAQSAASTTFSGITGTNIPSYSNLTSTGFGAIFSVTANYLAVTGKALDAANLIKLNENFIEEEAFGYLSQKYPTFSSVPTSQTTIGYIVEAIASDLKTGGNKNTADTTNNLIVTGEFNSNNTIETLDSYAYVRDLSIAAMRNWITFLPGCSTNTTSGNVVINALTYLSASVVNVPSTVGIVIGMKVVGAGIPANTFVKAIVSSNQIQLGTIGSKLNNGTVVSASSAQSSITLKFNYVSAQSSISTASKTGNTVTITTTKPHTFITGDVVNITCSSNTAYTESNRTITVSNNTSFTYTSTTSGSFSLSPQTGTIIESVSPQVSWSSGYTPVINSSIIADNSYPQCADVASSIVSYYNIISTILSTPNGINNININAGIMSDDVALNQRATLFTLTQTGSGSGIPHNMETGTPVKLVPKATNSTVDPKLVRLPAGIYPDTTYYVIAPGRRTQSYDYSSTSFDSSNQQALLLATSLSNANAGIYIFSSETSSVDPNVIIEVYQYVKDVNYDLIKYQTNLISSTVFQTQEPHSFDIPLASLTDDEVKLPQKVFFAGSVLPSFDPNYNTGSLSSNSIYYVRYIKPTSSNGSNNQFTIHTSLLDAKLGVNPARFISNFTSTFYTYSNRRRSPIKFDPTIVTSGNNIPWYLQVDSVSNNSNTTGIYARFLSISSIISNNPYFIRYSDNRKSIDKTYQLRYVIPKNGNYREPINGFVLKCKNDDTRNLLPQKIVLKPVNSVQTDFAILNYNGEILGLSNTTQKQGSKYNSANPSFVSTYDPYANPCTIEFLSNITCKIQSARQITNGSNNYLQLTVFDHNISPTSIYAENILTEVNISTPSGGNGYFTAGQSIAWYSSSSLLNISTIARSIGIATIVTTTPHGLSNGDLVTVTCSNTTFSVTSVSVSIINSTTFSYSNSGSDVSTLSATGTTAKVSTAVIHACYNGTTVPFQNQNYLILRNISSAIKYNSNDNTIFTQVNTGSTTTATLLSEADGGKSNKSNYLYAISGANVYTLTPGDVININNINYYIDSVTDVEDLQNTYYIFNSTTITPRIAGQQDGVYYLSCLRGDIQPYPIGSGIDGNFQNFKFSQPISRIYPLNYVNDPLWFQVTDNTINQINPSRDTTIQDPPSSISAADNFVHGYVTLNDGRLSSTKETITTLINDPGTNGQKFDGNNVLTAQSGIASSGAEERLIPISGNSDFPTENKLYIELRRPSIARSGNHSFEYLGYGPGNYSTSFPSRQQIVLTNEENYYAQSKRENGGIVLYTGLNSNGDIFIGNLEIDAITGQQTYIDAPIVEETENEASIGGLVTTYNVPVLFNNTVTFNNPPTNQPIDFNTPVLINSPSSGGSTLYSPALTIKNYPSPSGSNYDVLNNGNRPSITFNSGNIESTSWTIDSRGTQSYSIRTSNNNSLPPSSVSMIDYYGDSLAVFATQSSFSNWISQYSWGTGPNVGDILLKGGTTEKYGSLGWIYTSNIADTVKVWKEVGVIGAEALRTNTDQWGNFKLGINTIARSDHSYYSNSFVTSQVAPQANLDVVGTAFISGTIPQTFLNQPSGSSRTFTKVNNALIVGGTATNQDGLFATLRVSTTDNNSTSESSYISGGRVGINTTSNASVDRNLVINGNARIVGDFQFNNSISTSTTSGTFNLLNNSTFTGTLNIGSYVQSISLGTSASVSQVNIGNVYTYTASISQVNIGNVYTYTASNSVTNIKTKQTNIWGDLSIGYNKSYTDTLNITSNTGTVNLFSNSGGISTLNLATNAGAISIGSQGGITSINNNLNVLGSITGNNNITLNGGSASYTFSGTRNSLGSTIASHSVGSAANRNVSIVTVLYTKNNQVETAGSGTWGGSYFQNAIGTYLSDTGASLVALTGNQYYLPLASVPTYSEGEDIIINSTPPVTATSGSISGGTVTLNFANQTLIPFAIGESIIVSGATTSTGNINGTVTVTASSTSSVSYTTTATGSVTGTITIVSNDTAEIVRVATGGLVRIATAPYYIIVNRQPYGTFLPTFITHPERCNIQKVNVSLNATWLTSSVVGTGTTTNFSLAPFGGTLTPGSSYIFVDRSTDGSTGEAVLVGTSSSFTPITFSINNGAATPITEFSVDSTTGNTTIAGTASISGNTSISSSTASTNTTTGALVVTGGVGIGGNLNVGGNLSVGGGSGVLTTSDLETTTINGGQIAGNRNRIINGAMAIDQRNAGTARTITAAALTYTVDRFYAYCTGANVTGQRVTGANAGQYRYQFTGASSVTGISFGQRIETLNSADLAGNIVTLGVDLANSLLTTVTWAAYYGSTTDIFAPARNLIATGTFTVTSTVNRYNVQISIPSAAYTGIEIVFSVGAQTSGTWTIGNVQLELGSIATPFERRSYQTELNMCQRYYETSYPPNQAPGSATTAVGWGGFAIDNFETFNVSPTPFVVTKRTTPTMIIYAAVTGQQGFLYNDSAGSISTATAGVKYLSQYGFSVYCTNNALALPTLPSATHYTVNFAADAEL